MTKSIVNLDPSTMTAGGDYQVVVQFPDGRQVTILIPEWTIHPFHLRNGEVYGLNLISEGHFT